MERTLIQDITEKGLQVYFNERKYPSMYYPTFFPFKTVFSLDYKTLIGEIGAPVAADVIAYDASAPLKTRKVVSSLSGSIPKIAVKRKMKESDLLQYHTLRQLANADEEQLLNLIYSDLDFVVESVAARMEYLALKIISQTKLSLSISENNGIVTEEAIDFLMPADNKFGADVVWSAANATTMTPIDDFKAVVEEAESNADLVQYALMDTVTFRLFTKSKQVQDHVKTYGQITASGVVPFMSLDYVNAALTASDLPQIIVVKQAINIESKSGDFVKVNPWNSQYVTFIPQSILGNMLAAPIAEELHKPEQVLQVKTNNILVSRYSNVDPVTEFTKGEINAFPSWKNIQNCYSLDRNHTTWN